MITIYFVALRSPTSAVRAAQAELQHGKHTWALWRGRRHLLGASAFFTAASARRAKLALLIMQARLNLSFLDRMYPHLARRIREQLADPNHKAWSVIEQK